MNEVLNTLPAWENNSRLRDPLQAKNQNLRNTRICICFIVLYFIYRDSGLFLGGWGFLLSDLGRLIPGPIESQKKEGRPALSLVPGSDLVTRPRPIVGPLHQPGRRGTYCGSSNDPDQGWLGECLAWPSPWSAGQFVSATASSSTKGQSVCSRCLRPRRYQRTSTAGHTE